LEKSPPGLSASVKKRANGMGEALQGEPLNNHQEQGCDGVPKPMLAEQHL
jgi:hypothetical protein